MKELIDELNAAIAKAAAGQQRCSVCDALRGVGYDERVSLQAALNSKLGAKRLSIILKRYDIAVGVPSIHRHRQEGHTP